MTTVPQFLVLTPDDCAEVLRRNHVGRLAYLKGPVVDIEPIGYVKEGDWIFFRSAYGAKLEAVAHTPYVAFEVDEVRGPFDWKSVVAHGTIYMFPGDGAKVDQRAYERGVAALRTVVPEALTPLDPVPERWIVYGLHVDSVDGRMAQSTTTKRGPPRRKVTRTRTPRRGPGNGT
ncbi:MAG TPA: pyridoxamine 5'-phosphate oxidase family protein [Gemmatimonadaceae bacterium]|nr:pyridoxamine 5'-phosphate oxidase family protein [Gemmatimonadaceae bacterium]